MTVEQIELAIGEISVKALRVGGEPMLDKVTNTLGPVTRHLERIRLGELVLTDGLMDEIHRVLFRARKEISG